MTIPAGETAITNHVGNGTADTFDYEFKITAEADLLVTQTDLTGVDTVLVLTTDYTVTGVGDEGGGSITLVAGALTSGWLLAIEDNVELSQLTPYGNQSAFYAQTHENSFDKVTRLVRRSLTKLARTLTLPPTAAEGVSTELPPPQSQHLIRWDTPATALENVSVNDIATTVAFSNFNSQRFVDGVGFTAGVTTQLTLSSQPGVEDNTQVYFDGVYQSKTEYSLTTDTITFSAAIPGGVGEVEVVWGTAAPASGASPPYWARSTDEISNGITPADTAYMPFEDGFQHVLRHGTNSVPGTTDMSGAFQDAVDALSSTEGGVVLVPAGRYSIQSKITVSGATFINGGVKFLMHPRAVLEVEGSATAGIEFVGASEASPMNDAGIEGGRIVGTEDGAVHGVLFKNCSNWHVRDTSIVQFSTSGGRGDFEGTHDGSNNASVLSDSTAAWVVDSLIGLTIFNVTDGSYGTITDNDGTTVTVTLSGGTDNDWDTSDIYKIVGRAGLRTEYAIWGNVDNPQIDTCDVGINLEGNNADTFRSTTNTILGGSIRTCHRGIRIVDGYGHQILTSAVENCSIGVDFDWRRLTGTNNATCIIQGYFERNGRHIRARQHGTAISTGLVFRGMPFENVSTTYLSTDSFEDANSGDYKIDLDCADSIVESSYWSTAPSVSDVLIAATSSRIQFRKQGEAATGFTVTDNTSSTIYDEGAYEEYQSFADADATPSVKSGKTFVTGNTGATTITDLDDGYIGQVVVIRFGDSQTTVDFTGTNLRGNAGVDWSPVTNDFMVARKVTSTIWLCEVHDTTA